MALRHCAGVAAAMSLLALSTVAAAQTRADDAKRPSVPARTEERPQGMAEFGVGLLTLPGAEICVQRVAECAEGDTSLELTAWQLFRITSRFAVGAGIGLALTPTTDPPRNDPVGLPREHERRYFSLGPGVRWYPHVGERFEFYLGVQGGLVVVSDEFIPKKGQRDQPSPSSGAQIRTEGWELGAAVGVAYVFNPSFSIGGHLRYGEWFLPRTPKTDIFLDEASLTGPNEVFSIGFNVSYRVAL